MFTLDAAIDTVQNGKKQFVNTFVPNESIKETLNSFVDAQGKTRKERQSLSKILTPKADE